jgi:hypothetical protein
MQGSFLRDRYRLKLNVDDYLDTVRLQVEDSRLIHKWQTLGFSGELIFTDYSGRWRLLIIALTGQLGPGIHT